MRDRSEGWMHAKLTGHINEDLVSESISNGGDLSAWICSELNFSEISLVRYGGINEKGVDSVFGGKTKSKTDISFLAADRQLNLSLKKSRSGQVFLITPARFISGYSFFFGEIPENIVRALGLYFGSSSDVVSIINSLDHLKYKPSLIAYMAKKNRLVAEAIKDYDAKLHEELIQWFRENIANIFYFCFSSGLAENKEMHATHIMYCNLIGEGDFRYLFDISELYEKIKTHRFDIDFGKTNGGSTIQLPFGFVQWHQHSLQFHHNLDKIIALKS